LVLSVSRSSNHQISFPQISAFLGDLFYQEPLTLRFHLGQIQGYVIFHTETIIFSATMNKYNIARKAFMSKSINEMTIREITDFLESYNNGVKNRILDFKNDYDFSDDTLFNIIVAIHYLAVSKLNENAEEIYSELLKKSEIELSKRLGKLPTID
jgi:hypothetical protein